MVSLFQLSRAALLVATVALVVCFAAPTDARQYVLGISSGAFAAVQYHVAFSASVSGLAIFSGGPFYCAQGSMTGAMETCMYAFSPVNLQSLELAANLLASAGDIDPLSNIDNSPVWIFHGTSDTTVPASINDALYTQYQNWGANAMYNNATDANHAWISPSGPNSCTQLGSPYINNCPGQASDPELEFLGHLFGTEPKSAALFPAGQLTTVSQDTFAQSLYHQDASAYSMDSNAYLYTPPACAAGKNATCDILVVLHGCQQGYATIGNALIQDSNLQGYADTNNFVVLFPQAIASLLMGNSEGCWDWWGYTGGSSSQYVTKSAPQLAIINTMAKAITEDKKVEGPLVATE